MQFLQNMSAKKTLPQPGEQDFFFMGWNCNLTLIYSYERIKQPQKC